MATPFYSALDAIGYDCVLTPYMEGWRTVKSQNRRVPARTHRNGRRCHVRRWRRLLRRDHRRAARPRRPPDGTPRRVVVAHFDRQTQFDAAEFETFDLVRDVGALPVRIYDAVASTDPYPAGYPQPGVATEAPAACISSPQGLGRCAPKNPLRTAPEPTPDASPAPPGAPRPQLVLIDHENIDWTLGTMIEPLRLDEQTRPRWEAIKRFATSRANGGQVLIKSFLQDNDRLTGFAQFLRNELDIVPIILAPEDDTPA